MMNKIKILEVLNDALQDELEIKKVIILYTNGETFEIDSEAEEGEEDIIPQPSENAALSDGDVNDDVRLVEFQEIDEFDNRGEFQEPDQLPETKEVESEDFKDKATIVLEGDWTHINYLPFSRKINILN